MKYVENWKYLEEVRSFISLKLESMEWIEVIKRRNLWRSFILNLGVRIISLSHAKTYGTTGSCKYDILSSISWLQLEFKYRQVDAPRNYQVLSTPSSKSAFVSIQQLFVSGEKKRAETRWWISSLFRQRTFHSRPSFNSRNFLRPLNWIAVNFINYICRERKIRRNMLATNPSSGEGRCCQIWGSRRKRVDNHMSGP